MRPRLNYYTQLESVDSVFVGYFGSEQVSASATTDTIGDTLTSVYFRLKADVIVLHAFLPRDAMHKRGLCCHAVFVCLSVRLSVTFVDHVKTNKHIFEIFSPSGSQAILVFPYQTGWRYSDGKLGTP